MKERHEVTQSCLGLCDPIDCSLSGSSVHVIFQVRILEWVAFPSPGDLPNPETELRSPTLQAETPKIQIKQEIQHLTTIQTWRGHRRAQITLFRDKIEPLFSTIKFPSPHYPHQHASPPLPLLYLPHVF